MVASCDLDVRKDVGLDTGQGKTNASCSTLGPSGVTSERAQQICID
jgi:hypothetical protein